METHSGLGMTAYAEKLQICNQELLQKLESRLHPQSEHGVPVWAV